MCRSVRCVVSYRNSTSNHNSNSSAGSSLTLYLIEILHQTTTQVSASTLPCRCILSKFYIKPQLECRFFRRIVCCILSKFYIKPQLSALHCLQVWRCILSKFYIKPQLRLERELSCCVVSYRNSTSNHNASSVTNSSISVVSYRNSTSNHNHRGHDADFRQVVSYRNSTSNHNDVRSNPLAVPSCILSKFYIKPQHRSIRHFRRLVVSYRNSTSNHNVGPHID